MSTPAPTPRTDAEEYTVETMANYGMGDEYDHHVVDVEFARTLERENAELEQENAKLRAQPYLTEQEDRAFESWYDTYNPAHKADKQRARDAYEAGWKAGYKHGAWADTPQADSVLASTAGMGTADVRRALKPVEVIT